MPESREFDPKWIMGAPKNHPIVDALGRYHSQFATVEFTLEWIMTFALGHKRDAVARAILSRIRNIADRIEIIRATAEASRLGKRNKFAVGVVCDKALEANARRNLYAHSMYEYRGDEIRIKSYAFSSRASKTETLKLEKVEKDIEDVGALMVMALYFTGAIPDEFLQELETSRDKSD